MKSLIYNIGRLYGVGSPSNPLRGAEMSLVPYVDNAFLYIEEGRVAACGEMSSMAESLGSALPDEKVDARGAIVHPAFCDSHTHLVWAGDRTGEFVDKIKGLSYEEIAANGGGILNSADRLNAIDEDELFKQALRRLRQVAAMGTGAIEIKSGYGLSLEGELKMLRVIERLKEAMPGMVIRSNFLGAHAVGRAFEGRQGEYVDHLIGDMLPAVAGKADFVDVFCDRGFFTPEETDRILKSAALYGIRPKIHANELDVSGGVQVGVANDALSVDHLERIGQEEIDLLSKSDTVATMLPGASFFLGMPYAPARKAITGGCAVALASDYNPGSSPSGSMPFVMSLACIKMKLLPVEALNATTVNGAFAMNVKSQIGSLSPGQWASFVMYKPYVPSLEYICQNYTEPTIDSVWLKGVVFNPD